MKQLAALALLCAATVAAPAATQPAALAFGPAGKASAARLECIEGQATLSLWLATVPRGVTSGEFSTVLRFFQGRRAVEIPATGTADGQTPIRLAMPLADPAAFLEGTRRNGRLVIVSYAGRSIQPLPPADAMASFLGGCAPRR